jgi:hypothetical protein
MSRFLRSKKAVGKQLSKPPPSWFDQSSSSEEESRGNPESFSYWADFELPDYLSTLYPAGYNFMTDVLQRKECFKTLDFDEPYKKKICFEVCKIYMELEISKVYISQHGSSAEVNERMKVQLPGWNLLLSNAESSPRRRNKRDKNYSSLNKKLPGVIATDTQEKVDIEVGSEEFWRIMQFRKI